MKYLIILTVFDKLQNIKCDFPVCEQMALYLFRTLNTKHIDIAKMQNVIVCPKHARMLIAEGESEQQKEKIPYVVDSTKKTIKCFRCGHIWTPYTFRKKHLGQDTYMDLPGGCADCRSRAWKYPQRTVLERRTEEAVQHV